MEVQAKAKHIRISPKKARPIANLVRGKNAREAQVILGGMPQKAAKLIAKVLNSAMANAENNFSLDKGKLTISEIRIDEGSVLKRYRPRARGMVGAIKKRTSHISIVVSGDVKTKKKVADKKETKSNTKAEDAVDDSKKIEIERPQEKINVSAGQKGNSPKMFRRKTG